MGCHEGVVIDETLEEAVGGGLAAGESAFVIGGGRGEDGIGEVGVEGDNAFVFGVGERGILRLDVLVEVSGDVGVLVVVAGVGAG